MIETLGRTADVEAINISPGGRNGLAKHIHKSRMTFCACWRMIRNRTHPRIMYMGCEGDWGLIYTLILAVAARALGYVIFLHHHSFSYVDRPYRLMRAVMRVGGDRIRHIFLCSRMQKCFENTYGDVASANIISNAAFVNAYTDLEVPTEPKPLRLGLLSNLTREKGLYTFIELLRLLRRSNIEVKGILAGPITDAQDMANVTSAVSELGGTLAYIGPIYGTTKDSFYREIDIFVFPTEYANEAQPTVLFEALASGSRIVAYDRGCIASQIGTHGLTIPIGSDFCKEAYRYIKRTAEEKRDILNQRSSIVRSFRDMQRGALESARSLLQTSTEQKASPIHESSL
ncbi:glycosyltransferase family 4 protein [Bradyrhizobium sp. Rc2d]|uniref:glycosyltransferase family 4 protein n=1 Tax=Bradyrhizobium sp. Rc2d TaxID=1855321 RepID=UPI000B837FC3|nr:glycosyltransferase family 4 protein [Bradyrhizobium sp. Rc2d]